MRPGGPPRRGAGGGLSAPPHGPHRHGHPRPHRAWWRIRRGLRRRLFLALTLAILASTAYGRMVHAWLGDRPEEPLALGLGLLALVWGLAGLVSARLAFPLVRLAEAVRRFGDGALSQRMHAPRSAPAEVRALSSAFDAMAERIEGQFRAQRELVAAVSHELRTPLARMRLTVELARERGAAQAELDALEREIEGMDALVADLLARSRLDAGAVVKRPVDLVALARDAVTRAVERGGPRSYALEAGPESLDVSADPALLTRALAMLVDNAERHGTGEISVHVEASPPTLAVEDEGPGIPEAEREAVFAPYARGRGRVPDEARGVGLGLHLVRRIAEAHGGTATAEASPRGGARVVLRLPSPAPVENVRD